MMEIIKRPFIVLWKTWFFLMFLISGLVLFLIFKWYLHKGKNKQSLTLLRRWGIFVQYTTGIILRTKGRKNFPKAPYIVVSNHSSYLDIVLMFSVVPDYFAFLGKAELENWPIVNIFFKSGMQISVPRGSRKGSHEAYTKSKKALEEGTSLVIFPEATIPTHVPRMKSFKNGAFKLAIESGVPIVPICFPYNYKRMMNGGFLKAIASPGLAPALVHSPIETTGMSEEDIVPLRQQVFKIIEKDLNSYGNK
ncbi:MAG: 1-acyl-sn-glycerol-3-phosphate acyltransferase [Crocinitomicaceae bacterium]|nr:1-acyl-sn-glycerol-3-phosphate acyltransferase [Crocinitomicaceae bacterium]|tara:strand:+ start:14859 stop:15608 length:750 start_codon:yes stop_codon:yes gene_type:complete